MLTASDAFALLAVAAPQDKGTSWTTLLLGAATLLGGIVAAIQLPKILRGRRRDRALESILDGVANGLDAEAQAARLDDLTRAVEEIRRQIDFEVPLEARRVYLTDRATALVENIGALVGELDQINSELEDAAGAPAMEGGLRQMLETSVMPAHRAKVQQDRRVRVLLGVIVALFVVPPALQPYAFAQRFVDGVGEPFEFTTANLAMNILLGALFLGVAISVAATRRWRAPVQRFSQRTASTMVTVAAAGLGISLAAASLLWLDSSRFGDDPFYWDGTDQRFITATALAAIVLLGLATAAVLARAYTARTADR